MKVFELNRCDWGFIFVPRQFLCEFIIRDSLSGLEEVAVRRVTELLDSVV